MKTQWRKTLRQLWWSPLLCFGLAWVLSLSETFQQFEWNSLDLRTRFRVQFQPPPDPRLILVLFDDDTYENLTIWPPSRQYHANLIELLAVDKARIACMDVFMTAPREEDGGEGDRMMVQGVIAAQQRGLRVVTGAVSSEFEVLGEGEEIAGPTKPFEDVTGDIDGLVGDKYAAMPYPGLRGVSVYGFVDVPKETADGVIRQPPLVIRVGRKVYPSLSLQTLMAYYDVPATKVRVRLGDAIYLPTKEREIRIPVDARGRYLLNYRYEHKDQETVIPSVGYRALLLGLHSKFVEKLPDVPPPPEVKGKIAIVGLLVTGNADVGPSPLSPMSPLPLVHANIMNNVLADDFARPVPAWMIWSTALLLGYIGLVVVADRSLFVLFGGALLGVVSYVSFGVWAWVWGSWWVPLVAPLVGFCGLQIVVIGRRIRQEQQAKMQIKGMFGAYLAPQLVDRLVRAGKPPQLGGHEEEITAYFSDIQGYSTFSEKLSAPQLVELLNDYLTACTDIVQEEGGTLDKYIGDAVVAMFGAPIEQKEHAYRACVTALRVQAKLGELRARWTAEGQKWPLTVREMRTRVGLNTGPAIVGNMGSRTRFNYTMTGDHVNLAARMESGAKSWGAFTMCTESTRAGCVQHGGDRVVFRPLGRIVVKGRSQAVPIFELTGLKEDVTERTRECLGVFAAGLERYYARDWDKALALFKQSEALEPLRPGEAPGVGNNPSIIYQDIVRHYRADPPPEDWDGVFVMKEK